MEACTGSGAVCVRRICLLEEEFIRSRLCYVSVYTLVLAPQHLPHKLLAYWLGDIPLLVSGLYTALTGRPVGFTKKKFQVTTLIGWAAPPRQALRSSVVLECGRRSACSEQSPWSVRLSLVDP